MGKPRQRDSKDEQCRQDSNGDGDWLGTICKSRIAGKIRFGRMLGAEVSTAAAS